MRKHMAKVPAMQRDTDIIDLKAKASETGVSGREIAKAAGVGVATVSRWLNRQTPIPDARKRLVARLLRLPVEALILEEENKSG